MNEPFAITLPVGGSRANHTGTWRTERPEYVTLDPPCNRACPSGEDPRGWLYQAEEGSYEAAWRLLVDANPFPAIMGRVCYRPCETACNRGRLDEAVGINAVERFLGDEALRRGWRLPDPGSDSGRRVLVVGAGPCGLAAAYHLRRRGHAVTVLDGERVAGGMMTYGIPAYRLPRRVLTDEIDRLLELGIELHLGERVGDLAATLAEGGWDAAVVAVGAQLSQRVDIPAGDSARVLDALALLHGVADDERPVLGRRVAVYGGGDTALDAARTARRLGATDAVVVYRRTRERMPAHASELAEAAAEGITVRWLSTIERAEPGRLRIERVELGADGRPVPTGVFEDLEADALVLAVGQASDLSLLAAWPQVDVTGGVVHVDGTGMTGRPGVFAGGDAVGGERTVTTAIGEGRRAALGAHAWMGNDPVPAPDDRGAEAGYERLNPWYYDDAPRTVRPQLQTSRRVTAFDEVVGGLDQANALYEARRCLSCGSCFECDNCYGICPDNAVIKLAAGQRYVIDYDYCKGCGICAAECPCGAIDMVPESI